MNRTTASLIVLMLAGCATPALVPAGVTTQGNGRRVAYAEAGGVELWADGTWSGDPVNLPDYVTPVLLTIKNNSGRTVRLAFEDFALRGSTGTRYAALPPFSIQARVGAVDARPGEIVLADYHPARSVKAPPPPIRSRIYVHRFHVAPPYAGFYAGWPLWGHPWAWNSGYYSRWSGSWPRFLPTDDMLQRALPEGALEPGGVISGHLYFQNVLREGTVELVAALHEAGSAADLGTAVIPFTVQR